MNTIKKLAMTIPSMFKKVSLAEIKIKEKLKDVAIKAATAMMTAVLLLALYGFLGLILLFALML